MAIEPTNMARLCTAKWQPLWVKLDAHKYCQIFVSPYTWDYLYYYNNEWHNVGESDMYYYDRTKWVKVTDESLKLQYSNKVRDFSVTPATMYTVKLTTNGYWWSLTLNWTSIEEGTELSVAEWTSITVNSETLTIWDYTVVAVPEEWYHFVDWTEEHRWDVPATVTWDLTVEAEFMDSWENVITIDTEDVPEDCQLYRNGDEEEFPYSQSISSSSADAYVTHDSDSERVLTIIDWEDTYTFEAMSNWDAEATFTYEGNNIPYGEENAITVTAGDSIICEWTSTPPEDEPIE
jgi:hypothetical protein